MSSAIKYFFFVCLCLASLSCSKLNEQPYSFLTRDNFYTNQSQVVSAVNAAYGSLTSYIMNCLYLNVLSDEGTSQVDNDLDIFTFDTQEANIATFWSNCYTTINMTNEVLAHADAVTFDTDANRNAVKGEAKFLRALMYLYLATYYGDVPKRTDPTTAVNSVAKSPVADIYQLVISDLTDASNLLPATASVPAYPNKYTATAFLAKTYLYTGNWDSAAIESLSIINSNQYQLITSYDNIWLKSNENNKEMIYSIQTGTALSNSWLSYLLPADVSDFPPGKGIQRIAVEKAYIRSFDSADKRKTCFDTSYVRTNGTVGYVNQGLFDKFMTKTGLTGLDKNLSGVNFPLLRYADILLIYAEAEARQAGAPDAVSLGYLNMIRRRAYGLPLNTPSAIDVTATTLDDFIALLLRERYWEFGGEGQRWADLLRTKTFVTVMQAAGKNLVSANNRYFPIPYVEVVSSNNVVTQNPDWQ